MRRSTHLLINLLLTFFEAFHLILVFTNSLAFGDEVKVTGRILVIKVGHVVFNFVVGVSGLEGKVFRVEVGNSPKPKGL
jgi:hypothetical protein